MKSSASRDVMTSRVKETFAKWRSFHDVPETTAGSDVRVVIKNDSQVDYVNALYALCGVGEVVGRSGDMLFGKTVKDTTEEEPIRTGRVLNTKG